MTKHLISIEVEADSLEEARKQIKSQIAEGSFLLSEKVVTNGGTKTAKASAQTIEAAFAKAQGAVAQGAEILEKREIVAPTQRKISVEAFDEQSATTQVKNQIGKTEIVNSLKLVAAGKRGFLGIGKQPNQYLAEVFQQAAVEITYKSKAKITAKIGIDVRSANDKQKLDNAERTGTPVEVVCENCGRVCKALAKPIGASTVMVMTPQIAIIAARYCETSNIVVCGACVGVSLYATGLSFGGRRCPKCGEETGYAAVCHLRMTNTKLV